MSRGRWRSPGSPPSRVRSAESPRIKEWDYPARPDAYARHYAQRFPQEVAALLLLDPLHEDSPKYWPEETQKGREQVTEMLGAELPEALVEAYRGVFRAKLRTWPEQIRESLIALHLAGWRTGVLEGMNLEVICEELRRGGPTPDVPLVVMTALDIDPAQRAFTPDQVQRKINEGKRIVNELRGRYRAAVTSCSKTPPTPG